MRERLALIDADSFIYIIAWNNKELYHNEESVQQSCDSMLRDCLLLCGATHYIGVFGSSTNFRHERYRFADYKGNRGEKPESVQRWEKTIKEYFISKHNFYQSGSLEADDICVGIQTGKFIEDCEYVICSPDKDLRQVPGLFFDYRSKVVNDESIYNRVVLEVTPEQAQYNFWLSMITGDSTDNIKGIPGLGPVKAKKLLDGAGDIIEYGHIVKKAYSEIFHNYSMEIFDQTYDTLLLICPLHRFWPVYKSEMKFVVDNYINIVQQNITGEESVFQL